MAEQTLTTGMDLPAAARSRGNRPRKALDLKYQPGFGTIAVCCLVMLYVPILVLVIFSFTAGDSVTRLDGFGIKWYLTAIQNEGFHHAALTTLKITITATTTKVAK